MSVTLPVLRRDGGGDCGMTRRHPADDGITIIAP
jgi:hypothetical protein